MAEQPRKGRHAPAPPRPPQVLKYNPNETKNPEAHRGFAVSHKQTLGKKFKETTEPQALVLRKFDEGPSKAEEERVSLARAGETILETFYGMLYKTDNDTREWKLVVDGFIPLCIVQEHGNAIKPFKIIAAKGHTRVMEFYVSKDAKCSRLKAFVKWFESTNAPMYGARFAKENQADQFHNAMQRMKSTLVKTAELLKQPERKKIVSQLSDSGPVLHSKISLIIKLPNQETTIISVPGLISMSELFERICGKESLDPAQHLLSVAKKGGKEIRFEPETVLGSLNIRSVAIIHVGVTQSDENKENSSVEVESLVDNDSKEGKLVEIHLPSGQKTSVKLPLDMRLGNVLTYICKKEELNTRLYVLQYLDILHQALDADTRVGDLQHYELRLIDKQGDTRKSEHRRSRRRSSRSSDSSDSYNHINIFASLRGIRPFKLRHSSSGDDSTTSVKESKRHTVAFDSVPTLDEASPPIPQPTKRPASTNLNSGRMFGSTPELSGKSAKRKAPPPPRPPHPTPKPRIIADEMPTSSSPSPPPRSLSIPSKAGAAQTAPSSPQTMKGKKRRAPARPSGPHTSPDDMSLKEQRRNLSKAAMSLESGLDSINEKPTRPPPVFIPPPPPDDIPPPLHECERPEDPLSDEEEIQDMPWHVGLVAHEDFTPHVTMTERQYSSGDTHKVAQSTSHLETEQRVTEHSVETRASMEIEHSPTADRDAAGSSPTEPTTSPETPSSSETPTSSLTPTTALPLKFLVPTPESKTSDEEGRAGSRIQFVGDSRSSSVDNISSPDTDLMSEFAIPQRTLFSPESQTENSLVDPPDSFTEVNKFVESPFRHVEVDAVASEPLEPLSSTMITEHSPVNENIIIPPPPPMDDDFLQNIADVNSLSDAPSPIPPPMEFTSTPSDIANPPVEFCDELPSPKQPKKKLVISGEAFPWLSEPVNTFDSQVLESADPLNSAILQTPSAKAESDISEKVALTEVPNTADSVVSNVKHVETPQKELTIEGTITEVSHHDPNLQMKEIEITSSQMISVPELDIEQQKVEVDDVQQSSSEDDYKTPFDDLDETAFDVSGSGEEQIEEDGDEDVVVEAVNESLIQSRESKSRFDLDMRFLDLDTSKEAPKRGEEIAQPAASGTIRQDDSGFVSPKENEPKPHPREFKLHLPTSPDVSAPPTPPLTSPPGSGYVSPTLHTPLCSPRAEEATEVQEQPSKVEPRLIPLEQEAEPPSGKDPQVEEKVNPPISSPKRSASMSPEVPSAGSSPSPPNTCHIEPIDLPNPPPVTVPPLRRYSDMADNISFVSSALRSEQKARKLQTSTGKDPSKTITGIRPLSWAEIKNQRNLIEEQNRRAGPIKSSATRKTSEPRWTAPVFPKKETELESATTSVEPVVTSSKSQESAATTTPGLVRQQEAAQPKPQAPAESKVPHPSTVNTLEKHPAPASGTQTPSAPLADTKPPSGASKTTTKKSQVQAAPAAAPNVFRGRAGSVPATSGPTLSSRGYSLNLSALYKTPPPGDFVESATTYPKSDKGSSNPHKEDHKHKMAPKEEVIIPKSYIEELMESAPPGAAISHKEISGKDQTSAVTTANQGATKVVMRKKTDDGKSAEKLEKRQSVKDMMALFGDNKEEEETKAPRRMSTGRPQQSPALRSLEEQIDRPCKKYGVSSLVTTLSAKPEPKPFVKRDSKSNLATKSADHPDKGDSQAKPDTRKSKETIVDNSHDTELHASAAVSNDLTNSSSNDFRRRSSSSGGTVTRSHLPPSVTEVNKGSSTNTSLKLMMASQITDTDVVPKGRVAAMRAAMKSSHVNDTSQSAINVDQAEWI